MLGFLQVKVVLLEKHLVACMAPTLTKAPVEFSLCFCSTISDYCVDFGSTAEG